MSYTYDWAESWYRAMSYHSENLLLFNIRARSGSGIKGHSKVKFRFENNFYPIHMTGLKLGIWVCHVVS